MKKNKKVNIISMTLFHIYTWGFVGLIFGVLYSIGGFFNDVYLGSLNYGTILAFGALVGMPLIAASCGLVAGLFSAMIYNFIVVKVIKVDLYK